jgi:hypothetical protein
LNVKGVNVQDEENGPKKKQKKKCQC